MELEEFKSRYIGKIKEDFTEFNVLATRFDRQLQCLNFDNDKKAGKLFSCIKI